MRKFLFLSMMLSMMINCGTKQQTTMNLPFSFHVELKNSIAIPRIDELIEIDVQQVENFNPENFYVYEGDSELPSQPLDADGDGYFEKICFLTNFKPEGKKTVKIVYDVKGKASKNYLRRAYAELSHRVGGYFENKKYVGGEFQNVHFSRVPPQHTDHSGYYRYEGPGWESDKVGYRFYLDWRNAIDIFGKKKAEIVLPNIGQDGFGSYHEMSDWGMDIFKVGNSLGIGSIAMLEKDSVHMVSNTDSVICEILADGPILAQIRTKYFGWKIDDRKYDLVSKLSIAGGSRMTFHQLQVSGGAKNLCTGFAKHENCELLKSKHKIDRGWQYLGYWGQQSLAGDNLGIAIFYRQQDLIKSTEDELSHIIVLQPKDGKLSYYFLAAWEKEPGGITNIAEFEKYLKETKSKLNSPILAEFKNNRSY